jgi:prepilin-type processing-associated H-X9-DG protein
MSGQSHENETMRSLLRAYLLETLDESKRTEVEERLVESEEWRVALEAERDALAVLDLLPEVEPAGNLTEAVLERIHEEEEAEAVRRFWMPSAIGSLISVTILVALAAILLPALGRAREAARRSSSQNNMKQLGLVFKMYANESQGEVYPPSAPYEGVWTFDVRAVYPEYLTDLSILVNPSLPDAAELQQQLSELFAETPVDWEAVHRIVARSYTYPGWVLKSDADVAALQERFAEFNPAALGKDLQLADRTLYRPREGIERFFISDINNAAASNQAQSEIPILFETVGTATDNQRVGCNVLYMDGHVEFVPYGEEFPVTDTVKRAFPPPP